MFYVKKLIESYFLLANFFLIGNFVFHFIRYQQTASISSILVPPLLPRNATFSASPFLSHSPANGYSLRPRSVAAPLIFICPQSWYDDPEPIS